MLVIGSGAGALVTAVTAAHAGLAVTLVEKAPVLGSTTAWSGGWLWIPRNPLALAAGINEDPDEPRLPGQRDRRHRRRSAGRRLPRQRPEMLRFFEETPRSPSSMATGCPTSTRRRGRARGGRSVAARPYDGRRLGAWIDRLRPPLDVISLGGLGISSGADLYHFVNATRSLASARHVAGRFLRHGRDLARLRRSTQLVNGNALVARLVRSALDLGVTLRTDAPALALVREDGRVAGARIGGAAPGTIRARRGSLAELAEERQRALAAENPFNCVEHLVDLRFDSYRPLDFLPPVEPGAHGPVYEFRTYHTRRNGIGATTGMWRTAVPGRLPYSPLTIAITGFDGPPRLTRIWRYPSLDARASAQSVADGNWPPKGGPDWLDPDMTSAVARPLDFSPLQ